MRTYLTLIFFINFSIILLKIYLVYLLFLCSNLETELEGIEVVLTEKNEFLKYSAFDTFYDESQIPSNYCKIIQIQNNFFIIK